MHGFLCSIFAVVPIPPVVNMDQRDVAAHHAQRCYSWCFMCSSVYPAILKWATFNKTFQEKEKNTHKFCFAKYIKANNKV